MFAELAVEEAGEGKLRVEAIALNSGHSALIWVLGGERPHIGVVAVAQGRASLEDPGKSSCNISMMSLLGHKEEVLAYEMARRSFDALKRDLALAIGVHVDDATEEEVAALARNCEEALSKLLDRLTRTRGPSPPPAGT